MRSQGLFCCALLLASCVHAGGVNLQWSNCYGEGTGLANKTFACSSNTGTNVVVISFVPSSDIALASGNEIDMDVSTAGATLPAWWQFKNAGACRQTSLGFNTSANPGNVVCVDWASGKAAGGIGAYTVGGNGPNTAHLKIALAVPLSTLATLAAGTEYFSFNLTINNAKTAGAGSCGGCETPACISVSSMKITTNTAGGAGDVTLTTPTSANSNYVFWQDGLGVPEIPGGACIDSMGFSVTTAVLGRGSITRSRYKARYPPGSPISLSAAASPGDRFIAWTGDTTVTTPSFDVTVNRNLSYFATFERDPAAAPSLVSLQDVPHDQSHLGVTWNRGAIDQASYPGAVCCYWIERTLNSTPMSPWVAASGLITATMAPTYFYAVITPADSSAADPADLRYRIVMQDVSGTGLWMSNELTGHSVDDLPPNAPASVSGVMASGVATLFWSPVVVSDLSHYALYRAVDGPPPADVAHLVATTNLTNYNDSPGYFANYAVAAVDVHGNKSAATPFVPLNSVNVGSKPTPGAFTVGNPAPSPMTRAMSLLIGVPSPTHVTVDVIDSQGRLVRRLNDGDAPAGWLTVSWDARDSRGGPSAAGVYFVRAQTPEKSFVRRLVLIQ